MFEGSADFQVGEELLHATRGSAFTSRRESRIKVTSKEGVRMLMIYSPAGTEGMFADMHFARLLGSGAMLWSVRNSRGRPVNAPAAFIHPCRPTVARTEAGRHSAACNPCRSFRRSAKDR